jgi:hypothetical protein
MEKGVSSQAQTPRPLVEKRQNVSLACTMCRQKRNKVKLSRLLHFSVLTGLSVRVQFPVQVVFPKVVNAYMAEIVGANLITLSHQCCIEHCSTLRLNFAPKTHKR